MARPLRVEYPGAVYHVTSRGNERKPVFKDKKDRNLFLETIEKANKRYNFICHAYCLMDNHYHLILETPDGNLSKGMKYLNGVYSQKFNVRHKRVGHVFQGRYKAILVQKESHLLEVIRYVVLNPVRADIAKKPGDWRWSSYNATAGKGKQHPCTKVDWILAQFGVKRRTAEKKYMEFVNAGIGQNDIWKQVQGQCLLGEDDFIDSLLDIVKGREDVQEIPKSQRYLSRPNLDMLLASNLINRKQDLITAVQSAVYEYGYTQNQVADHLGIHYCSVSRMINAKCKT
jgi:REP element-mobilizing transposase RayT